MKLCAILCCMRSERGSALTFILIGVALFASLSYVVAQMVRGGQSGALITDQRASLLSDEVVAYGRQLRQIVQQIKITEGCGNEDISFEATGLTGYDHTPVASDNCKVFHPDGGGFTYIAPSEDISAAANWIFTGDNVVDGVGTTSPDLVAMLPNLTLSVCNSINEKLNTGGFGGDAGVSFTPFQDTYAATETLDDANGLPAGCLNSTASGDNYFFYQVLIAR